jgi:hypothetical protein
MKSGRKRPKKQAAIKSKKKFHPLQWDQDEIEAEENGEDLLSTDGEEDDDGPVEEIDHNFVASDDVIDMDTDADAEEIDAAAERESLIKNLEDRLDREVKLTKLQTAGVIEMFTDSALIRTIHRALKPARIKTPEEDVAVDEPEEEGECVDDDPEEEEEEKQPEQAAAAATIPNSVLPMSKGDFYNLALAFGIEVCLHQKGISLDDYIKKSPDFASIDYRATECLNKLHRVLCRLRGLLHSTVKQALQTKSDTVHYSEYSKDGFSGDSSNASATGDAGKDPHDGFLVRFLYQAEHCTTLSVYKFTAIETTNYAPLGSVSTISSVPNETIPLADAFVVGMKCPAAVSFTEFYVIPYFLAKLALLTYKVKRIDNLLRSNKVFDYTKLGQTAPEYLIRDAHLEDKAKFDAIWEEWGLSYVSLTSCLEKVIAQLSHI